VSRSDSIFSLLCVVLLFRIVGFISVFVVVFFHVMAVFKINTQRSIAVLSLYAWNSFIGVEGIPLKTSWLRYIGVT
jgi:hypothetical protein